MSKKPLGKENARRCREGDRRTRKWRDEDGNEHVMYEARWLWERACGPVPAGLVVHHRDGNPANDALDNLTLMARGEHAAHHCGGTVRSLRVVDEKGVVRKLCPHCEQLLPLTDFGWRKNRKRFPQRRSWCRECQRGQDRIGRVGEAKTEEA